MSEDLATPSGRPRPEDDVIPYTTPLPSDDPGGAGAQPILRVEGLVKSYDGHEALKGISFELYPGDILGFLGPNGAGKTTALRILATIIKPNSGTAQICGHPLDDVDQVRRKMGYMPDFIGTYDDLTVDEYMEFFARAYLVPSDLRSYAKQEALATTGLQELADRPVRGLSRGQTQRLALARLLMHDPPVLLLDEPAAGLDPRARVHLRDILKELQKKGKAIIVSSHVLEDLADLSNKIAVIDQGVLLAFGATKDLMGRLRGSQKWRLRVKGEDEAQRLKSFLDDHPEVLEATFQGESLLITLKNGEEAVPDIHQALIGEGFKVVELAEVSLGLEELYLRITGAGQL